MSSRRKTSGRVGDAIDTRRRRGGIWRPAQREEDRNDHKDIQCSKPFKKKIIILASKDDLSDDTSSDETEDEEEGKIFNKTSERDIENMMNKLVVAGDISDDDDENDGDRTTHKCDKKVSSYVKQKDAAGGKGGGKKIQLLDSYSPSQERHRERDVTQKRQILHTKVFEISDSDDEESEDEKAIKKIIEEASQSANTKITAFRSSNIGSMEKGRNRRNDDDDDDDDDDDELDLGIEDNDALLTILPSSTASNYLDDNDGDDDDDDDDDGPSHRCSHEGGGGGGQVDDEKKRKNNLLSSIKQQPRSSIMNSNAPSQPHQRKKNKRLTSLVPLPFRSSSQHVLSDALSSLPSTQMMTTREGGEDSKIDRITSKATATQASPCFTKDHNKDFTNFNNINKVLRGNDAKAETYTRFDEEISDGKSQSLEDSATVMKQQLERRFDPNNNQPYTKEEFLQFYGDHSVWNTAKRVKKIRKASLRRTDVDGNIYTKQQFYEFYGGLKEWKAATPCTDSFKDYSERNAIIATANMLPGTMISAVNEGHQ